MRQVSYLFLCTVHAYANLQMQNCSCLTKAAYLQSRGLREGVFGPSCRRSRDNHSSAEAESKLLLLIRCDSRGSLTVRTDLDGR